MTTPIYYANSSPHIGHAFTATLADVLTRFYRQRGYRAHFLTGTDEHGEKIAQAAEKQGTDPQSFVDQVSQLFRDLWPGIGAFPDDFIRTTEARHKAVVHQVLQQLHDAGEIYRGEYRGLYCTGCERFMTEKELVGGNCKDHGRAPHEVVEENYMFRMEKHREWLKATLEENPSLLEPERYRLEVLAILREPIGDLSISRPRARVPWGIPMPFDEDHVVYVWFDALLSYVSALGGPGAPLFQQLWGSAIHLMAKDIVKQHGIYWPIMLHAAGIPLFRGLRVHGYWLINDTKMSKSLANSVGPTALVERYGIDALRYHLCRDMTFGNDAEFSELALASRLNSDLANDLGNLLSRTLTMIQRYCDGRLPTPGDNDPREASLVELGMAVTELFDRNIGQLQLSVGIEAVLQLVRKANQYVQESRPWALAKEPGHEARLGTVLYHAAESLRLAAVLLHPVMPERSVELLRQLGCTHLELNSGPEWDRIWGALPVGAQVAPGDVLFPRVDLDTLRKSLSVDTSKGDDKKEKQDPEPAPTVEATVSVETPSALESAPVAELITIDEFARVQLRVARIVHAEPVPKASRLLKLSLEVGDEQRQVVSGIAEHYRPEDLIGRTIVMVYNLKPAKLRGVESQGMILAAEDAEGKLALVTLDRIIPSGAKVR